MKLDKLLTLDYAPYIGLGEKDGSDVVFWHGDTCHPKNPLILPPGAKYTIIEELNSCRREDALLHLARGNFVLARMRHEVRYLTDIVFFYMDGHVCSTAGWWTEEEFDNDLDFLVSRGTDIEFCICIGEVKTVEGEPSTSLEVRPSRFTDM